LEVPRTAVLVLVEMTRLKRTVERIKEGTAEGTAGACQLRSLSMAKWDALKEG
jgi:hypothetical protein